MQQLPSLHPAAGLDRVSEGASRLTWRSALDANPSIADSIPSWSPPLLVQLFVDTASRRRCQREQRRTAGAGRKATLRAALRADLAAARLTAVRLGARRQRRREAVSTKTWTKESDMTIIKKRESLCGMPIVGGLTYEEAIEHARHAGYTRIRTLAGEIPLHEWLPYAEPDWRIFSFCERRGFIVDELAKGGVCSSHWPLRR